MQNFSLLSFYQQHLQEQHFQPDSKQLEAITLLSEIQQGFIRQNTAKKPEKSDLLQRLKAKLSSAEKQNEQPISGLYMWGGVGRGKTWLMDLFFQSIPSQRKLRLHFHRFMLRVHEELAALPGEADPLLVVADKFKKETDLICFDEFFVSDITDAMLLGTLIKALFDRGITLVATSNIPPDELYRNGLQRARFLPAIEQIKSHCTILNVDAGVDYRLRTLTAANLWKYPLNAANFDEIQSIFTKVSGNGFAEATAPCLDINHRPMQTVKVQDKILVIEFRVLCKETRSQMDYIVLSQQFNTVFLLNVPQLNTAMEDQARRFLALIDEFYERHVKVIVLAEVELSAIYQGQQLVFEYQRCLSRLQEMQSEEYLKRPHLP
jgi:cell division protein ZapE